MRNPVYMQEVALADALIEGDNISARISWISEDITLSDRHEGRITIPFEHLEQVLAAFSVCVQFVRPTEECDTEDLEDTAE
jgi:hypothetical protein